MVTKGIRIAKDEREAIQGLADAIFRAACDHLDLGENPFTDGDGDRIASAAYRAVWNAARHLGYGVTSHGDDSPAWHRRRMDRARDEINEWWGARGPDLPFRLS